MKSGTNERGRDGEKSQTTLFIKIITVFEN